MKMYFPGKKSSEQIIASNGALLSPDANNNYDITELDQILQMIKAGAQIVGEPRMRHTVFANNANSTLNANATCFGKELIVAISGGAALTHTTETAANMLAILPNPTLYDPWKLRVINLNSGNLAFTPGANVRVWDANGNNVANKVMATNKYTDFHCYQDSPGTILMWEIGSGNAY